MGTVPLPAMKSPAPGHDRHVISVKLPTGGQAGRPFISAGPALPGYQAYAGLKNVQVCRRCCTCGYKSQPDMLYITAKHS